MNPRTVIIPIQPASFPNEASEILDVFSVSIQEFMHFVVDNYTVWECDLDIRTSRIEWFLRRHNDGDACMDYSTGNSWYSWQTTISVLDEFILDIKRQMDPYLIELGTQGNRWSYFRLGRTIGPDLVIHISSPLPVHYHA
jgi:hypothetical protein